MQFVDPRNDVAFKKIFGSEEHKAVTISFLNALLEHPEQRKIVDLQFLNTEQHPIIDGKKGNILDILCTDQSGKRYIIEIQVVRVPAFDKRIVFYAAKTYALQLDNAVQYIALEPVIAISILDCIQFPNKTDFKSTHFILDAKTGERDLPDLSFIFVELPKFTKTEDELVSDEDKWIYFLRNISKKKSIPDALQDDEFARACHAADRMTWTEAEFHAYQGAMIKATDYKGGLELARLEGKAEGKAEALLETAKNLLDLLGDAEITKMTGLPIDVVRRLREANKR